MNSTGEQLEPKAARRPRKGVLCAKCEHLNPPGSGTCERCQSHLYVTCIDCGTRNERVRSRCLECGRKMHRNLLQRVRRRAFGKGFGFNTTSIVLFLIGVALVFGFIVIVSNISFPRLW
jgi:hypothetical protein